MRFILRTLEDQSRLENREPITNNPNDYAVVIDGPVVGRIYRREHGPSEGKWMWFLRSPAGSQGMSDSLEAAKEDLQRRWFTETMKLSTP